MKQIFAIFLSVILIVTFTGIGISETIVNPDTIVSESTGFLTTLDPDWAYDAGSDEVAMQLYDNLVQYDGTSTINLLPMLSTNVPLNCR
jgi:ABC-type oligopeptide transport system substrate-binding subunit